MSEIRYFVCIYFNFHYFKVKKDKELYRTGAFSSFIETFLAFNVKYEVSAVYGVGVKSVNFTFLNNAED